MPFLKKIKLRVFAVKIFSVSAKHPFYYTNGPLCCIFCVTKWTNDLKSRVRDRKSKAIINFRIKLYALIHRNTLFKNIYKLKI